jgi:hypothetical protein
VADGVGGLGWAEEQFAVDLVQGADVGVDVDVSLVEVEVGARSSPASSPQRMPV